MSRESEFFYFNLFLRLLLNNPFWILFAKYSSFGHTSERGKVEDLQRDSAAAGAS